jgi:DNA polymerase-1
LLSTGHPAARALAEHREHQKIASTYGESFLQHVHPKSGRFHPDFKAIGATTGRSACSDPNLQNIPRGSHFRACFRAPPGRKMITADYSGAELRILAQASKDPVFVRTFGEGGDLHSIVATQIFGVRVSKHENAQLRERAKQINFGLAYGMGAGGLAHQLGTSIDEAQRLLDRYFSALPAVRRYLDASAQLALGRGWAETLAGRRFWLVDMNRKREDDGSKRRVAMNMPIQGTNADMIKLAMGRICRVFAERRLDAELVNMIHDELVVEANEAVAEAVRGVVVSEMVAAGAEFIRAVPVEVEAKIDDAWAK